MQALWRSVATIFDLTVAPAFGAPGYHARSKVWKDPQIEVDLTGKRFVVTGANAGIGRAATLELARRGGTVEMLCRSVDRGAAALAELVAESGNPNLRLRRVDMSDLGAVARVADELLDLDEPISALVHNAGALVDERRLTAQSLELTFACHVVGPHLLTRLLEPRLRASADSRVVWVTSGGMYTQRLRVEDLVTGADDFDGVVAYAQAKRAQVMLAHEWSARLARSGVAVSSMHPGWADTGGVRASLPRFHRLTRGLLRTPEQAADTIVWLAASTEASGARGELYLDRRPRREHAPGAPTRSPDADVHRLIELVDDLSGPFIRPVS